MKTETNIFGHDQEQIGHLQGIVGIFIGQQAYLKKISPLEA